MTQETEIANDEQVSEGAPTVDTDSSKKPQNAVAEEDADADSDDTATADANDKGAKGGTVFHALTPNYREGEDHAIYKEAFDFVFADDDIKNVAITGPYGSGKSSLIKWVRDEYGEASAEWNPELAGHKFMTISLSTFCKHSPKITDLRGSRNLKQPTNERTQSQHDANADPASSQSARGATASPNEASTQSHIPHSISLPKADTTQADQTMEASLEGEIINQIVYQSDHRRSPKSRLRPTSDSQWWRIVLYALYAVLTITCILSILTDLLPDETHRFLGDANVPLYLAMMAVWIAATIAFIAYLIHRNFFSNTIRRIGVKGSNIELHDREVDS